ncbi:MAG: sodium:solute symporter, partial [bacterium]|nr:sodium:solute symporter [bacterium]
ITFISTTGQSYVDGMRFVQFYFGLPVAMVILAGTAVPIFHRTNVYTAYEYLEQRFDSKTRALVSAIFLLSRGLAIGVGLVAPAIVLTVIFGWSDHVTTILMGAVAVIYTTTGGVKAVTWTEFPQMIIMMLGLVVAMITAVYLFPSDVGFFDAVAVAGAAGKINPVVFDFDWQDRYNIWSGLFGGTFLALAYFGCDQSQVQRYLTGKSIAQSRLSLLFNAVAKIPMQFFILFIGAIIFAFYTFEKPPVLFQNTELSNLEASTTAYTPIAGRYDTAFEKRKTAAQELIAARHNGNPADRQQSIANFQSAQAEFDSARGQAIEWVNSSTGSEGFNDTNHTFLTFVTRYLPAGVVGLVMAAIFGAAMSSISSEINSLATVTIIDIYKRHIKKRATDAHYLMAAKAATVFWGAYAVVTAEFGKNLGALIEAVNILGSLFYGGLLGVFVLAFFFKRVRGTAAFWGVLTGEAAIFATAAFTEISFLWYNVIGCLVVIAAAYGFSLLEGEPPPAH